MIFFKRFSGKKPRSTSSAEEIRELAKSQNGGITQSLLISEPTKSLLWVTEADTTNIQQAGSINIVFTMTSEGAQLSEKQNGYYAEPSLIWSKLPVEPNDELIEEAMYWPSYSSLSPKARYQYLRWLKDVTQPTNLSYVFLYFYGLERHLLVGDYDKAVDEIARLLNAHRKDSFVSYASRSLIVASLALKRLDITDRVPSLLEEEIDEALALRVIKGTTMTPEDIISISSRVGFKNKRYIKLYQDIFKEELQKQIDLFESQFGNLLGAFRLEEFRRVETTVFANLSIPENVRTVKIPSILDDKNFKSGMYNLLQAAHDNVKVRIAKSGTKPKPTERVKQPTAPSLGAPISDREIDSLIENTKYVGGVLNLHFTLQEQISEHYKKRNIDDNYRKAIMYCRAQIKIQDLAAKAFLTEHPWDRSLPAHAGYKQLAIILEKEQKYDEAIALVEEARENGWNGDWESRRRRLAARLTNHRMPGS